MKSTRRGFLARSAALLTFTSVAGVPFEASPAEARARKAALRMLSPREVQNLEILGDAILPGAAEAGLAYFVDSQLAAPADDALLIARYFNIEPPYVNFYRAGLAAFENAGMACFGRSVSELDAQEVTALVQAMGGGNPDGWQGPPAPYFYLIVRSDAIDVFYGTPEGFEKLGVPYMPHIMPPADWQ